MNMSQVGRQEGQVQARKHSHPKIISCQVNQRELTVKLEDERKISLPLNLIFSQWFLRDDIQWEQLKNYKIWGGEAQLFSPK